MSRQHPPDPTDPYSVLGVCRTATAAELSAAYRRLVRAAHPDNSGGDPDRLTTVVNAYRLLRDPKQRARYDRQHPPDPTERTDPSAPNDRGAWWPREPDIRVGPVAPPFPAVIPFCPATPRPAALTQPARPAPRRLTHRRPPATPLPRRAR
ncbi:curved DNA-binding protein CbpA [Saccharomonospora amisosensis]|uniref:Curved DNA-binding protein CbpA n=1 Tax=Saccharomonospora amisosensis TaxID=1128677 RepID=A0A7X5ZPQ2_9PSEU|nr:curved DNA-binding protein CbpA [Saccharomonospora amisosensis]